MVGSVGCYSCEVGLLMREEQSKLLVLNGLFLGQLECPDYKTPQQGRKCHHNQF